MHYRTEKGEARMWKEDSGRQNGREGVFPERQQLRRAVTPPPAEEHVSPVLRLQLGLCLLAFLLLAAARWLELPWYEPCREQYTALTRSSADLTRHRELVRFAGAVAKEVQAQAGSWLDRLKAPPPKPLTGQGGLFPQKTKKLPDGYSLEEYLPDEPLALPLEAFYVTSPYGWREHPISGTVDFHSGIDLTAAEGTPVTAAQDGFVLDTGRGPSYGNFVLLLHRDGVLPRRTNTYCMWQ